MLNESTQRFMLGWLILIVNVVRLRDALKTGEAHLCLLPENIDHEGSDLISELIL